VTVIVGVSVDELADEYSLVVEADAEIVEFAVLTGEPSDPDGDAE